MMGMEIKDRFDNARCKLVMQVRMGSTRLPGKMRLPFHDQKTILEILVERLTNVFSGELVVVATTDHPRDEVIEATCSELGVPCFRGSEEDVLSRFEGVAEQWNLDSLIRICGDNPFLLTQPIVQMMEAGTTGHLDYCSFQHSNGVPAILGHTGLFAEFVSASTLHAIRNATDKTEHFEHATLFVLENPEQFNTGFLPIPDQIDLCENLRLTIDTQEDFEVCQKIYSTLYSKYQTEFDLSGLVEEVQANPEFLVGMKREILNNVKQKLS